MNAPNEVKRVSREVLKMVKHFDRNGFRHLEIMMQSRQKEKDFMVTVSFYKEKEIKSIVYFIDDKKVALRIFDLVEKLTNKFNKI